MFNNDWSPGTAIELIALALTIPGTTVALITLRILLARRRLSSQGKTSAR
jgi:hypothetical protein